MADSQPSASRVEEIGKLSISRRRIGTSLGAVLAAFLASLCCMGPVLFVTIGVGAGLARQFEPFRSVFTILTVALMAAGFYSVYGRRRVGTPDASCAPDDMCRIPASNRARDKIVLWTATVIAAVLLTFPQWSIWIL